MDTGDGELRGEGTHVLLSAAGPRVALTSSNVLAVYVAPGPAIAIALRCSCNGFCEGSAPRKEIGWCGTAWADCRRRSLYDGEDAEGAAVPLRRALLAAAAVACADVSLFASTGSCSTFSFVGVGLLLSFSAAASWALVPLTRSDFCFMASSIFSEAVAGASCVAAAFDADADRDRAFTSFFFSADVRPVSR